MALTTPASAGLTAIEGNVEYISVESAPASGLFIWIIDDRTSGSDVSITAPTGFTATDAQSLFDEIAAQVVANQSVTGNVVGTADTNVALDAITTDPSDSSPLESGDVAFFNPATSPATDGGASRERGVYIYDGAAWPTTPAIAVSDGASIGAASKTASGIVELLTNAEARAGVDQERVATAQQLAAVEPSLTQVGHVLTHEREIGAHEVRDLRTPRMPMLPVNDLEYSQVIYTGTDLPQGTYAHNGTVWFQI